MKRISSTRRQALAAYGSLLAASPLLRAQRLAGEPPGRIPPAQELINAAEFEAVAERKLDALTFAEIARQRAQRLRPYHVPAAPDDRYAADGSVHAAFRTKPVYAHSDRSAVAAEAISPGGRTGHGARRVRRQGAVGSVGRFELSDRSDRRAGRRRRSGIRSNYEPNMKEVRPPSRARHWRGMQGALRDHRRRIGGATSSAGVDWKDIDRLSKGISVPVVLKGVMSPDEARKAVASGAAGIVRFQLFGPLRLPASLRPSRCCRLLWMPWVGRCRS